MVSAGRKMRRDRTWQMAAALAYQTLFSMLPLLVLTLLVLHSVAGLESAGTELRRIIVDFLVPDSLLAADGDPSGSLDPAGSLDAAPAPTGEEVDDARRVLIRRLDGVIEQLSRVSFAGLGVAGFLLFLYGATALVRTVENAFNLVYQADPPRPGSRLPVYFTLLTVGPVALVAGQVLQGRILAGIGGWMGGWPAATIALAAPLAVTCVVLVVAFRTLPNTWVSWRAAGIGGFWSGIAWFAFQEAFGAFFGRAGMTSLYGALALLPMFLLWVYWSWMIILAGLTLAYTLQYFAAEESLDRLQAPLPGDPRWLVPIMVGIGAAFARGETATMPALSRELRLSPRILRPYLVLLERQGLLRRLSDRGGVPVLALARPMPAISVREILELASPPAPRSGGRQAELLDELRRAELEAAGDLTLDQLVPRAVETDVAPASASPPATASDPPPVPAVEPAPET